MGSTPYSVTLRPPFEIVTASATQIKSIAVCLRFCFLNVKVKLQFSTKCIFADNVSTGGRMQNSTPSPHYYSDYAVPCSSLLTGLCVLLQRRLDLMMVMMIMEFIVFDHVTCAHSHTTRSAAWVYMGWSRLIAQPAGVPGKLWTLTN